MIEERQDYRPVPALWLHGRKSGGESSPAMKPELVITPEAECDIQEAYEWYENRLRGLGGAFLISLDDCFDGLLYAPKSARPVHLKFRRTLLRRFPFAVFYEFEGGVVTVYSVFHTSRDPEAHRDRLDNV